MTFENTSQTSIVTTDHRSPNQANRRTRSTSKELAQALARLEPAEIDRWRDELVVATADLARAAGTGWTIDHAESTVALTRIVAHLALVAPTAESALAGHLIDAITLAGVDDPDRHQRSKG